MSLSKFILKSKYPEYSINPESKGIYILYKYNGSVGPDGYLVHFDSFLAYIEGNSIIKETKIYKYLMAISSEKIIGWIDDNNAELMFHKDDPVKSYYLKLKYNPDILYILSRILNNVRRTDNKIDDRYIISKLFSIKFF